MKKKIITIFLSCFMIISTAINSFAMPIVSAIPISYEALMALMGAGVAFGLALPKDDSEYYDYTNSLRKHLQVVDDKYLELLDKSVKQWKDNNDHKPEGEKDKLKIPYIPGLSQLFKNVGNDVSTSYTYVNTILNPIKEITKSDAYYSTMDFTDLTKGEIIYFDFVDSMGENRTLYVFISPYADYGIRFALDDPDNYSSYSTSRGNVQGVALGYYPDSTGNRLHIVIKAERGFDSVKPNAYLKESIIKNPIPYSPKEPNIENEELQIELPNISIPEIESIPGYYEGLEPPFEVAPPYSPDSPGTDSPGTDSPGTDSPGNSEGLFPDKPTLTDYIKSLIVPSDSFWTDTFNDFRNNFSKNFPMLDMSKFDSLAVGGKPFPNLYAYGSKIVDGDVINSIVDWLRPIIAGFIMICLMFFNYRKIYKLIRNTEPFGSIAQGSSDFRTGLSAPPINNGLDSNPMGNLRDTLFDMRNEILRRENEK